MLQKFFVAIATLLSYGFTFGQTASLGSLQTDSTSSTAEDKKPPLLKISGSLDVYYKYDLANTAANGYTSFTSLHNNFTLGMASVKFEHAGEKVSAVADLGFGPRAKEFSYTDEGITRAIKQLYISYAPADWIKFTAGTWATHVGYELLDPQLNRNYSMSYMFTNGPFSHTGLKAEISKGKHGFMVGLANATDYRFSPTGVINRKFMLAQYSIAASEKIKLYLNYAGGQNPDTSKSNQFDAVLTVKISDKFNIGYNGTINSTRVWDGKKNVESKSWWGSAAYFNLDPADWWGITLRTEYFNDKNQFKPFIGATEGGSIFSTTLSANFRSGGLIIVPEFRLDQANKAVLFTDKNGGFVKKAGSLLLGVIYSF